MAQKLLLADDSVTIQRVIELTFADEDVEVLAVSDGQQAIDRIEADPPDIVLADVDMPKRDGYEVASYVKSRPKLAHIPVVLLTGAFEPIDQARATAVGSDDVLAKPFEPQMVINRVKQLLGRKVEAAAPRALQHPPAAPLPAVRPAVTAPAAAAPPPHEVPARPMIPEAPPVTARPAMDVLLAEPGSPVESVQPTVSLDDYFDQLDAAFANLHPSSLPAANEPAGNAPPAERESFDWMQPPPPGIGTADDWNLDDIVSSGPSIDALDAPLRAAPVGPMQRPQAFQAQPVDVKAPVELPRPLVPRIPEPVPIRPSVEPRPLQPQVASPLPPAAASPSIPSAPLIADAFAALLAAEQGEPVPPAPAPPAEPAASARAITEELIEEVVSRVLQRLGDRVVRETVTEMVSRIAERLVREEIERIKQGSK